MALAELLFSIVPLLTTGTQPTDVAATYRSGQTYITWTERSDLSRETYRVYRSSQPIDADNIDQAILIQEVAEGSATFYGNRYRSNQTGLWQERYLQRFIIEDDGAELPDGAGLLVWTLGQEDFEGATSGLGHYAVTTVDDGVEDRTNFDATNTVGAISELIETPAPIRTGIDVGARGTLYLRFQDLRNWNPTLHAPNRINGYYGLGPDDPGVPGALQYGYEYVLYEPPTGCTAQERSPLLIFLHGWKDNTYAPSTMDTTQNFCGYKLHPLDVGETWWFGFARDHDFRMLTDVPTSDVIVNYTEQRVLEMIQEMLEDPTHGPSIDPERIYLYGHSMGGSGTLAMSLRYPEVFAAAHANDPMTDYSQSGEAGGDDWRTDVQPLWGSVEKNVAVELAAPDGWGVAQLAHQGTGVWDWQDHQRNLIDRRRDEMVPLGLTHGSQDTIIEWETQGQPVYGVLDMSDRAWGGEVLDANHAWKNFAGLSPSLGKDMMAIPFAGLRVVRNESVPGLSSLSSNSPIPPDVTATYNANIEWASSWNPWDAAPLEDVDRWELSLRTTDSSAVTVDVTPRRPQAFRVDPGAEYRWENRAVLDDSLVASGSVFADADGLVTVPSMAVSADGNRLSLEAVIPAPELLAAFAATPTQGQAPLSVSFQDGSTGDITGWNWSFGDGATSTQANPAHLYTTPGTYTVTLIVSSVDELDTLVMTDLIVVEEAQVATVVPYGCGVNPANSLTVLSGDALLGTPVVFALDNPLGTQAVGSIPALFVAFEADPAFPCGSPLAGWNMKPEVGAGELLIDRQVILSIMGPSWQGPGQPSEIALMIPNLPVLAGVKIYVQGVLTDTTVSQGVRNGLTTAFELTLH